MSFLRQEPPAASLSVSKATNGALACSTYPVCAKTWVHKVGIVTHEVTYLSIAVVLEVSDKVQGKLIDGNKPAAGLED